MESDLEPKEFKPLQPEQCELPTMEQERESLVEEEAKWIKEHHMEPDVNYLPTPPHPLNTDLNDPSTEIASEVTRLHRGSSTRQEEDLRVRTSESSDGEN